MAGTFLIVTSISAPNPMMRALADGAREHGIEFVVIGDAKSPPGFHLDGCRFYDLAKQRTLDFAFARACPAGRYSRKNIGYLLALDEGAEIIVETDDDNYPRPAFWAERTRIPRARDQQATGWINAYRYFSDSHIWPRGFPLEQVQSEHLPPAADLRPFDSPIQQGLVDANPDVDAVYRLVLPLPQTFEPLSPVALASGAWCPFNSQNTTWWREAAPLLYLPSTCSFRMSDIWRSFVAQRIAWENGWRITFHAATVWQDRNRHDLLADFRDEIPGYLHNSAIAEILAETRLQRGVPNIGRNLLTCYEALVAKDIIAAEEMPLLVAWLADISVIGA